MRDARRPLSPTDLTQLLPLDGCRRFLRFRLMPKEAEALLARYDLRLEKLSVLLQERGETVEAAVVAALRDAGHRVVDLAESSASDAAAALAAVDGTPTFFLQVKLQADLHGWPIGGRADLIRAERGAEGLRLLVADVKASRRDKVEHRLQVAFYARMVERSLAAAGAPVAAVSGAVVRLGDNGEFPDVARGDFATFDLVPYLLEIDHLLGPGGLAETVERTPLDKLPHHLSAKCDSCLYNGLCFTEAADREDVGLVPYLSQAEKRVLTEAGVTTLGDLAAVKALPGPKDYGVTFPPGEGKEALAARLSEHPIVGPRLDALNERARRLVAHLRRGAPYYAWLLHGGGSTLPSPTRYPDLVQVFLDAQYDYLQDRLYLLSALVTGPKGEFPVVLLTEGAPDDGAERDLLAAFLARLHEILQKAAGTASPRLHFYLYDPRDQHVLLDALRRHLDHLLGAPALYDLLTSPAALGQPLVSFLAHEVRERTNLPLTCPNLVTVASWLWVDDKNFSWEWNGVDYRRKFRAKLFDGHRTLIREESGRLRPPRADESLKGPNRARIEGASRFGSQVPLEYAYAVWGKLPRSLEWDDAVFRDVTKDDLLTFAFLRVRALQHVARSFRFVNDRMDKEPIPLSSEALAEAARTPALTQVLSEFLYFEHHAHEQELLAHFALPAAKRAATGRTLLARMVRENGRDLVLLPTSKAAAETARMKEGDWVVVNAVENPDAPENPRRIACGMLCRIVQLAPDRIVLNKTFAGQPTAFKRAHVNVPFKSNLLVSLDEMVDDLNADKILEALQNAEGNPLHRLLTGKAAERVAAPEAKAAAATFAAQVDALTAPRSPTAAQRRFAAETLDGPLHLLQGPPGTGKSHATGWTILGRAAAAHGERRMFRAFVTAKTHSAIRVLLESVAKKRAQFTASHPESILRHLLVVKLASEGDDDLPAGVVPLNAYDRPERVGPTLGAPSVVLGATPGSLYTMLKRHFGQAPWTEPLFDLVVIDEASQMGIPEALLACAFLKPDGQILVVGDHRQMPPILAHEWDREARRSAIDLRPYLSVFEHLYERGFPRVGLDESFRMHREQARFLAEHIYRKDGLQFFSRREELLASIPTDDPFVAAVLDPRYPVVVVEHDEEASTQLNLTEAGILKPVLDALEAAGLDGEDGVGVVVPHRAQKAVLRQRHPGLAKSGAIDTVERFQGDERDVILVTATASDPEYVQGEAEFLLNPNRLNVALSRPRKKLIVVASRSVFRHLPRDPGLFDSASLWKRLRYEFAAEPLWSGTRDGVAVKVTGRRV